HWRHVRASENVPPIVATTLPERAATGRHEARPPGAPNRVAGQLHNRAQVSAWLLRSGRRWRAPLRASNTRSTATRAAQTARSPRGAGRELPEPRASPRARRLHEPHTLVRAPQLPTARRTLRRRT